VNLHVENGDTLLHAAVYYNDPELLTFLLKNGANVNAQSFKDKGTPLHYAAYLGNCKMAEILIEYGADINYRKESMYTPLHMASLYSKKEMVKLLLAHGAKVNAKNNMDGTPLYDACVSGVTLGEDEESVETVRILLENGADPSIQGHPDYTIIQMTLVMGNFETAKLLAQYGATLESENGSEKIILRGEELEQYIEQYKDYYEENKEKIQEIETKNLGTATH
ncbi:MAG: hypothetical protein GF364_03725, partial [Candidatus Lokiarchaeota archaeon]|nr:hypothetical protein [Candidatus Lokiarchaeota archaeon]